MKNLILTLLLVMTLSSCLFAQDENSDMQSGGTTDISVITAKKYNPWFYGGEFGFMFGDYSAVSITPQVGYKISNQFSTILKVGYSYAWTSDYKDASGNSLSYNQYGASLTFRYAPIRQFYMMLEPAYYSYENAVGKFAVGTGVYYEKERVEVPFIFLGAGAFQPFGNSGWGATAELKVDLLNDDNSPYAEWNPIFSVGVIYGF
ncbi:MAG: DUF2860 domain-containing protein [Ignavibacteria bacterium]|nr:DUF2860 domain-containing protein [Ignavibacteria bacterium]